MFHFVIPFLYHNREQRERVGVLNKDNFYGKFVQFCVWQNKHIPLLWEWKWLGLVFVLNGNFFSLSVIE
jgi:hypothetical protein